THGLPDMVVCCRLAAYEAAVQQQGVRLLLSGAVAIRPLTTQQIRQQLPRPLAELVFRDAALLEMAQSPLTLAMLRVALRVEPGRPAAAPPPARDDLFAQYVRGVLDRQYGKGHAPVAQDELTRQLRWLARQMERHNQSIFLIEQLQPSWLANGRWRWAYLLAAHALLPAILGLLVMGSFVELIRINPPYVEVNFLSHLAAWLGLESLPGRRLLVLFGLNLFAGLLSTVVTGLFFGWRRRRGDAARLNRRLGGVQLLGAAGVAGVAVMLPVAQTDTAVLALFLGGMAALGLALTFGGVSYGYSFRSEIRLRGPLKWSWRNGMLFGAGGMALSLAWSGVIWLRDPTAVSAWLNMLNMGLLFFLLGGLSDKQLQSEARPNEGMRIAGRNALLALVVTAVPAVVLTAVTVNFQSGVYTGIMVGVLAGTVHGFNDLGKHAILRLLLWRRQQTSLRYARLLDWAADCLLLQKVGGGYTFRHRLLQAYFADRRA
ncbi:MAG: hypothetical protein KC425_24040, partial [Anaerolineales bacterium]|nr:hypothetical protein [Anaerolineales bacterium]